MSYTKTCMDSRKMVLMNLFAGQQWKRRHRVQICGHSVGRRGRDKVKEGHGNICITISKNREPVRLAV